MYHRTRGIHEDRWSFRSADGGRGLQKRRKDGWTYKLEFDDVLRLHTVCSACLGLLLVVLPHRLFLSLAGDGEAYSHLAHEVARCYGALTLAQAWLALRTRGISDGRVRRMLAEAYAICYSVTALALARAAWSAPRLHGFFGALTCLLSLALASLYAYFRFVRKLKQFELPGGLDSH